MEWAQPPRPPPQTGCPHAGRAESPGTPIFQNTRATARPIHGLPAAARAHTSRRDTAVQAPVPRTTTQVNPHRVRTKRAQRLRRPFRTGGVSPGRPVIICSTSEKPAARSRAAARRVSCAVCPRPLQQHRIVHALRAELPRLSRIRTKQLYSLFVYVVRPRGKADAGRRTAEARGHVQICAHKLRADSGKAAAEKGYLPRLPGWVDRADSLCMIVYTSPGSGGRWCPRCAAGRRTSTGAAGHVRNEYGDIDVLFIGPSVPAPRRRRAVPLFCCARALSDLVAVEHNGDGEHLVVVRPLRPQELVLSRSLGFCCTISWRMVLASRNRRPDSASGMPASR